MDYYNRYSEFLGDVGNKSIPFIDIPTKPTDKTKTFDKAVDRLDTLSFSYYGTTYFDWLIRMKNANLGADEFEWQDGDVLLIPYPLRDSVQQYLNGIAAREQRYFTKGT